MEADPAGYANRMHVYDEAFDDSGEPRPPYQELLAHLEGADLGALTERVGRVLSERGVVFGGEDGHEFRVDPVPRILTAAEWETLTAGIRQRVRALEAFLDDAYGEQRLVAAGVVPESVVGGSPYFEKDLVGVRPRGGVRIGVAGLDVVRDADGGFRILEDNVRTPSGVGYAMAASDAVTEVLGLHGPRDDVRGLLGAALRGAMEAAAPDLGGELVLLSDGPSNSAWYEHQRLADLAGLVLATPAEVRRRGSRLELADGRRVRSVYRRCDDGGLRTPDGQLRPIAELLLEPLVEGELGLVNWYGTGVADDKAVYAYVDDLIRHLLGQEPLVPSVTTYDLRDPRVLDEVLERLPELVVKPRDGLGGEGVVVGPATSAEEIDHARVRVREDPEGWIAQDAVALSTVPAVIDGRLAPRHCDLRPFAYSNGTEVDVPRGGLTRVALEEGEMVVNSSRQGGGKATWVV